MTANNKTTRNTDTTARCEACNQTGMPSGFLFWEVDGCTCAHLESAEDPHVLHEACDEAAIRSLEASLENPEPPTTWSLEELQAPQTTRQKFEKADLLEEYLRAFPEDALEYAPDAVTVQANRDHEGICEMLLEAPVEVPPVDWDALLPENAVWVDAEPAPSPAKPTRDGVLENAVSDLLNLSAAFESLLADAEPDTEPEPAPSPAKPAHDGAESFEAREAAYDAAVERAMAQPLPTVTPKVRDISPMFDTPEADWQPEDPAMFLAAMTLANATHSHPEDQARNDAQLAAAESYLETTDDWDEYDPAPSTDELAELRAKGLDPAFVTITSNV